MSRRWLVTWITFGVGWVLLGGLAVALDRLGQAPAGSPTGPASEPVQAYACIEINGSGDCERKADDYFRRARLADADHDAGAAAQDRLNSALKMLYHGLQCRTRECQVVVTGSPGGPVRVVPPVLTEAEVDVVRRAIEGAGFGGPVVRLSRRDDPAPRNTVIFAVQAGAACVVGTIGPDSPLNTSVVGRLPGGTCLDA